MSAYYQDDWLTVYLGDCREVMASMEPESVHCVVTSPPYWGLRDYGTEGQLGLEPTPEAYVESMVAVFREVRRVLRSDGTVWLNLGDSYTGSGKGGNPDEGKQATNKGSQSIGVLYGKTGETARQAAVTNVSRRWTAENGMAPKNLVGIPWRVAFALQADGWYLRSDIIWSKPNPMPESVTDRPTKSHEYLFLLSKSPRYYYDADAVREPHVEPGRVQKRYGVGYGVLNKTQLVRVDKPNDESPGYNPAGRNIRSVWTIATEPYGMVTPENVYADGPLDTLSPDCPVHSLRAIRRTQQTASDGELLDRLRSRSPRSGSRRAPVLADGQLASFLPDSQDDRPATTGSAHPGSSVEPTPGSALASRTPSLPTSGDGRASDDGTLLRTSRTTDPTSDQDEAELARLGAESATGRSELESRTTDESDAPGSSAHSTADRTPDTDAETSALGGQCSCPKYDVSHFATFPQALVEPCIKAGCPVGGTVLDPFAGSGTTGLVAQRLSRRAVLIDLNGEYLKQVMDRNRDIPLGLGAA